MSTPAVAITMPIGAWHPLLPTALRSLQLQDIDLELAIFDASNDPRVSDAIAASGLDVALLHQGPDGGQSAAIAQGWAQTEAPYIGWLNADDILLPGALRTLAGALDHRGIDVAFGESSILSDDGATIGFHGQVTDVDIMLARSNCISQPSALARRSAIDEIGGLNPDLHFTMDWDLWLRLFQNKARFERLNGVFSAVYWGDNTKTASLSHRRYLEMFRLSAESAGLFNAFKTIVFALAQSIAQGSNKPPAGEGLFSSADQNPREIGQAQLAIPVLNVADRPLSEITLNWDGTAPTLTPSPGFRVEKQSSDHVVIKLHDPVAQAETFDIALQAAASGGTRFRSAQFTG